MFDPRLGLSTISSWTPTLDPSNTVVMMTTTVPVPHFTYNTDNNTADSSPSYWIRLILKISILCGWFSERLRQYARLVQEACNEAAEERRLRSFSSPFLHSSSVLKPFHPKTPTSFTLFRYLPAELRQQIWEEALPGARLLMLELPRPSFMLPYRSALTLDGPAGRGGRNVFSCAARPPALLHVSHEARTMALKHYRLGLVPRGHPNSRIYVSLERDIIGFSNEVMMSAQGRNLIRLTPDLRMARHICLASAGAAEFLAGRQSYVLERVKDVAVVDSGLFGEGILPRVCGLDWGYWVRWQCKEGKAKWVLGGEEYVEVEEETWEVVEGEKST
ncbi:hypothetical protein QBC38DRAFT_161529 [Podospora fimiseda]|uniref:2EXR domain-containing protein n=1 Tax=Podospora fimiseda TaxID=252190 RepID=A0AAN7BRK5_9PEZI|nr:hypothetical protein QBC38DRAFT_161529 [Podospora fimiseda]